ncbi:MAG: Glyoxalase-like domain [Rhodobacteraceae bacterium HLUCCA12]|nr:MAG: Glyoxalase-like domain [Rhodobacteraceae bacterium HLUCCA12]
MLQFDHLVIATDDLEQGGIDVASVLGAPLEPGGQHAAMGTHNRLLSLGPGEYLEILAIDPQAAPPPQPRWFALDDHAGSARPRAWALRSQSGVGGLDRALSDAPPGVGRPMDLARGDLRWAMTVPDSGWLPFDGLFPALIGWRGTSHPAGQLPDRGIRLRRLVVTHPQAGALRAALAPLLSDHRVVVTTGAGPTLAAEFDTPEGVRILA